MPFMQQLKNMSELNMTTEGTFLANLLLYFLAHDDSSAKKVIPPL